MAHPRPITLKEYLGITDDDCDEENAGSARACVLYSQKKWWNLFYRRNENRFFKDRHWTVEEFPELTQANEELVILEAGCGVGNFVIPLLEMNSKLRLFACDISDKAVEILKSAPAFYAVRCTAFQCDLLNDDLLRDIEPSSIDIATLVFVLSAVPPEEDNIVRVLLNIHSVLKPGGIVLFRDYAEGDQAQQRFEDAGAFKKPLAGCDKCFVRRDNTLSYFFTTEEVDQLFIHRCGYERVECCYIYREITNRKEGLTFKRKFIQGRYRKRGSFF